MWIDPKLLIAERKEEMEYMMEMRVFEVVDEKECYDNGGKPLMLKFVDKMKGEKCRSRLVCRDQKGHGDDFCVVARQKQLKTFGKVLEKRFEVKQTGHIGFGADDKKELKILNRTTKLMC